MSSGHLDWIEMNMLQISSQAININGSDHDFPLVPPGGSF